MSNNPISDEQLCLFNSLGLIPGPNESASDFLERAQYCLSLKSQLRETLENVVPFDLEDPIAPEILTEGLNVTKNSFDIIPDWIPLFFSNYRLAPWHGGCAWIFQISDHSPLGSLLQLRQAFRNSPKYLCIYQRDELIAHELTHTARMAFNEPIFEEFFAYSTSRSKFRRWFGPIVQSAKESTYFLIALFLCVIAELALLSTGHYEYYPAATWFRMIPIAMVIFALWRLWRRHSTCAKCFENLNTLLKDEHKSNAVLFRLTDKEILSFAGMGNEEILAYAEKQKPASLRWRTIMASYF